MADNEYLSNEWRPSPKFILRRDALRRIKNTWRPGRFLEVGAGTGTLTRLFLDAKYTGTCFDLSEKTRLIISRNLQEYGEAVAVVEHLSTLSPGSFDYLFAFEVLEHIKNELETLKLWTSKLKPGGRILVSVPAHQNKYSKEDEYVGHIRRYEKNQLKLLLSGSGYESVQIYSYGFPLGNITGAISRMLNLSGRKRDSLNLEARSIQSGIQRSRAIQVLGRFYNHSLLAPFCLIQSWFFTFDLGDGYIATGIKSDQPECLT